MVTQTRILKVLMNGTLIGNLEKLPKGGLTFLYDPAWLTMAGARPISLSLPLVSQPFSGAEAFSLPAAKCEILYFEDVKVLSVERFDRKLSSDNTWIMRLPQEDVCQALGISPNLKYQADGGPGINEVMQLLLGSLHPTADRDTFFRAQAEA